MAGKAMEHQRCQAHRTDGEPCQAYAIRGGTVCTKHGGSSPQVKQAANYRNVLREVRGADLGETNPLESLVKLVAEVDQVRNRLFELAGDDPADWVDNEQYAKLYLHMLERSETVIKAAGSANIDERLTRLSERQGETVGKILLETLFELELDAETQSKARAILARKLEAL